jgi:transposase
MGRGPTWTMEDKNYLRNHYPGTSVKELAKTLNRTESSIYNKIMDLQISQKKKAWTEKETEYIKQNYHTMDTETIAETLGRSREAVRLKANHLGLVSVNYKRPWTDNDTETLLKLKDEGLDNTEIAKRMERSLGTVYLKLKDHGLTQPTGHRYILMKAGLLEEGK